ncbi:GTP 3',8-cyclase MoaA [Stackebrandtia nassauensis]|uniref:GTP 3',8-cyclase n=1 Tax=Stackebrandtia nassauensis (strain DSM 44728 / CIP 108903 / NRRL B-16338 / NBRC 102104 / LLR-40K-21) TaxID=446470 RepID=D3Q4B3_STANL|nr:GTP 3',8-cyclase MoaA [Stackebrandtia nassauensis]ADD40073.1 molybdenum cofactor biosynthesis protein A [Stackebrandtia nassauensis DSM 44728]
MNTTSTRHSDGSGRLVDRYGRTAVDLRVSLTDRCNLRCTYCMPAEGLAWLPRQEILTDDEIVRLVGLAVTRLGVTQVRFTGGEPLLRPALADIVARTTALEPRPRVSLTTNAIGLKRMAPALREAGLDRVNISLDTLDPARFKTLAHRDRLNDTVEGIAAAKAAGLVPVKVNSVLMRGVNEDEAVPLLRFALEHGYELRFIEQMPLDAQHGWSRENMVTAEEILTQLRTTFNLTPDPVPRGAAPAETWLIDGGPAKVGVIGSVTRPFCGDCDRTRLTADGQVRACLFSTTETDLRAMLRGDASDEDIAEAWRKTMWAKLPGHAIDDETFLQPPRPMSAIGG